MLSGYCNNVTSNSGHIYRQLAGSSGYETVDGEGILHQSQNGNPGYGDWIVNNDLSGGESGYIGEPAAPLFDVHIGIVCAYLLLTYTGNWDLATQNFTTMKGNTVNPDQWIGGKNGVLRGNRDVVAVCMRQFL